MGSRLVLALFTGGCIPIGKVFPQQVLKQGNKWSFIQTCVPTAQPGSGTASSAGPKTAVIAGLDPAEEAGRIW